MNLRDIFEAIAEAEQAIYEQTLSDYEAAKGTPLQQLLKKPEPPRTLAQIIQDITPDNGLSRKTRTGTPTIGQKRRFR